MSPCANLALSMHRSFTRQPWIDHSRPKPSPAAKIAQARQGPSAVHRHREPWQSSGRTKLKEVRTVCNFFPWSLFHSVVFRLSLSVGLWPSASLLSLCRSVTLCIPAVSLWAVTLWACSQVAFLLETRECRCWVLIQAMNLKMYILWRFLGVRGYYFLTKEQIKSGNPRVPSQRSGTSSFKKF